MSKNASFSSTLFIVERPAAVLAAVYLALLIDGVAHLKGGFLSAFRAAYCRHNFFSFNI